MITYCVHSMYVKDCLSCNQHNLEKSREIVMEMSDIIRDLYKSLKLYSPTNPAVTRAKNYTDDQFGSNFDPPLE